jgi:hypothetical protein
MDLPSELIGRLKCSTPKSLEYACAMGLDLRILCLDNYGIWDYPETIESYVQMGGILTKTHLSYAVEASICLNKILHLFPSNFFDKCGKELHVLYIGEDDSIAASTVDIRSMADLLIAVLNSENGTMEDVNLALDHFHTYDRKCFGELKYTYNIVDLCFDVAKHVIAKDVFMMLIEKFDIDTCILAYKIFNVYRSVGSGTIYEALPENDLIEILDLLNLGHRSDFDVSRCLKSKSKTIVHYFNNLGFDVKACASKMSDKEISKHFSSDVLKYMYELGFEIGKKFDLLGLNYKNNIDCINTATWFMTDIIGSNQELKAEFYKYVNAKRNLFHIKTFELIKTAFPELDSEKIATTKSL